MYFRVVRFTDATSEAIDKLKTRIEASEGPPEGVPATGVQILFDADQGTAVAIQSFATAEDMRSGDEAMNALEASETPGTRVSVDMCELKIERHQPG